MYECMGCGRLFDEPGEYREYRGECFGFPAYEAMAGCPFCGGGYMVYEADEEETACG